LEAVEDADVSDGDSDSSEDDEKYLMPCCKQWHTPEAGVLVECVTCVEWYHLRAFGACPGEGITKKAADKANYVHVCRMCKAKEL
jgi:hypothetical protein